MASREAGARLCGLRALSLLSLSLLLGVAPAAGHGGKYSREKNEPAPPPTREPGGEFRMEKLNQLWEKAKRLQLSPVKLSELHADLKMQERDELRWKKVKAEGLDEDGEREAELTHGLSVILAKYGLDGRKNAQAVSSNYVSEDEDALGDPRLEKLWHKATSSGKFSTEDLEKLWRELQHHKEKVHEYNVLLETLSRTEEIHKNVVSPPEGTLAQDSTLRSKHAELKNKLQSINQGYDRLRKLSHGGYGRDSEFEEPRVIDLWDMAKAANFTEKELASLRRQQGAARLHLPHTAWKSQIAKFIASSASHPASELSDAKFRAALQQGSPFPRVSDTFIVSWNPTGSAFQLRVSRKVCPSQHGCSLRRRALSPCSPCLSEPFPWSSSPSVSSCLFWQSRLSVEPLSLLPASPLAPFTSSGLCHSSATFAVFCWACRDQYHTPVWFPWQEPFQAVGPAHGGGPCSLQVHSVTASPRGRPSLPHV
ncbi:alpha-2-macroglobulin receptor-associated protein isoform X1 [Dasypus novemcinctus]|uniref:alpha-2-macroglobulin receptor-associated protein isoform X1 n=1 Tax=Dasypus novemcinctus TaxID=9361 RepID=UPI0039C9A5CD